MQRLREIIAAVLSLLLMIVCGPKLSVSAGTNITKLTFSDTGITETIPGAGYAITGTSLVISSPGVYRLTGTCSEGSVEISKGASNVILILEDLDLASALTAPMVIKKTASVTIHLNGTNTLTNNEDPANETSEDTAVADAFEGAAIKAKANSAVTFCGEGTLNIIGNAKNGIKGGAETALTFNSGTYNVKCVNNGIASDGSLVFNGGTYTVSSDNDGIKSVPEETDTVSSGSVIINGGIYIINAQGDGIQADSELTINNGSFDITTFGGYNAAGFDKDTMSSKGLKASGDRTNVENHLNIRGGLFTLNTADDAVHSDMDVTITGGTFNIRTGDDGVHADGLLTLGTEQGYDRDPDITVANSYEGLEGANVYVYSGKYSVTASDDGINAAGGSDGSGGNDPWNPWNPGGPGHGSGSSDYNMYFYGGSVYVNCTGDGLDSNSGLYLYGGKQTVLSQGQGGDNSPLDSDGTMILNGSEVFCAGTNPMNDNPNSGYQTYYRWTARYSAGTIVRLTAGNETLYNEKLLRNINYMLYSKPGLSSQPSVSTSATLDPCSGNDWVHAWDEGRIITAPAETASGLKVFTCTDCGRTEYQTIPYTVSYTCDGHEEELVEEDKGYAVKFITDEHASISVYYTQDYTEANETNVTETVSRNSDTGMPDSTGNGQVNFAVTLDDGYEIANVTVEGGYNNLKKISADDSISIYRVTKITSELEVTVTTAKKTDEAENIVAVSAAMALEGTLKINFYLNIPDDLLERTCIRMKIADDEEGILVPAKDADKDSQGRYRFQMPFNSTQMRDEITVTAEDTDGKPLPIYSASGNEIEDGIKYSALTYIRNKLNSEDEKLAALVKAVNNNGKYAQLNFGYGELDSDPDPLTLDAAVLKDYAAKKAGSTEGLTLKSATVECETGTNVHVYYALEEGYSIDDYVFEINGDEVQAEWNEAKKYYRITADCINSDKLQTVYEFKAYRKGENEGITLNYGVYSYIYSKLSGDGASVELKNLVKSLYYYNLAAIDYFSA